MTWGIGCSVGRDWVSRIEEVLGLVVVRIGRDRGLIEKVLGRYVVLLLGLERVFG